MDINRVESAVPLTQVCTLSLPRCTLSLPRCALSLPRSALSLRRSWLRACYAKPATAAATAYAMRCASPDA
eukprot:248259-Rhodomonas_salina.1